MYKYILYVPTFTVYALAGSDATVHLMANCVVPRRASAVNEQAARPRAANHHCCTPVLVGHLALFTCQPDHMHDDDAADSSFVPSNL